MLLAWSGTVARAEFGVDGDFLVTVLIVQGKGQEGEERWGSR